MKKQLIAVGILSVCLFASGCGSNAVNEETKTEDTVIVQETETQEVETQEEETQAISQEDTYWEQVGIHDGIGTVYNGETVKLVHSGENASCINAGYEFEETAGFLQFAEINCSYSGADVRLWVKEKRECRIVLSGNYELEEIGTFNDYGKCYNLVINGKCVAWFEVEGDSGETALEDCKVYSFVLYPTEGLILNGYEFTDMQMQNVVKHFGNPNSVNYTVYDEGSEEIIYLYRKKDTDLHFLRESDGSYKVGATYTSSELIFQTADGKRIEAIDISLALTEEDIRADEEKTIYQLGDKIEINQVYMSSHPDMKDVIGDVSLTIYGISDDIVKGHVIISNPKSQDAEWIFLYEIQCGFLDENFNSVESTMGYNVALSEDGFDNGDFKDGDDCDIAFRMDNPEKIMYLQLGYNTPDGFNRILVKLK